MASQEAEWINKEGWTLEPPDRFSEADCAKVGIDYIKHITTLASGSLLLIATFIDKFPHPIAKWAIAWAISFLAMSIVLAYTSMLGLINYGRNVHARTRKDKTTMGRFMTACILSFLAGMLFLANFILMNVQVRD